MSASNNDDNKNSNKSGGGFRGFGIVGVAVKNDGPNASANNNNRRGVIL